GYGEQSLDSPGQSATAGADLLVPPEPARAGLDRARTSDRLRRSAAARAGNDGRPARWSRAPAPSGCAPEPANRAAGFRVRLGGDVRRGGARHGRISTGAAGFAA